MLGSVAVKAKRLEVVKVKRHLWDGIAVGVEINLVMYYLCTINYPKLLASLTNRMKRKIIPPTLLPFG